MSYRYRRKNAGNLAAPLRWHCDVRPRPMTQVVLVSIRLSIISLLIFPTYKDSCTCKLFSQRGVVHFPFGSSAQSWLRGQGVIKNSIHPLHCCLGRSPWPTRLHLLDLQHRGRGPSGSHSPLTQTRTDFRDVDVGVNAISRTPNESSRPRTLDRLRWARTKSPRGPPTTPPPQAANGFGRLPRRAVDKINCSSSPRPPTTTTTTSSTRHNARTSKRQQEEDPPCHRHRSWVLPRRHHSALRCSHRVSTSPSTSTPCTTTLTNLRG